MSKGTIADSSLVNLANAIRNKSKTSASLRVSEMPSAIETIPYPYINAQHLKSVSQNALIIPDTEYNAIETIDVDILASGINAYCDADVKKNVLGDNLELYLGYGVKPAYTGKGGTYYWSWSGNTFKYNDYTSNCTATFTTALPADAKSVIVYYKTIGYHDYTWSQAHFWLTSTPNNATQYAGSGDIVRPAVYLGGKGAMDTSNVTLFKWIDISEFDQPLYCNVHSFNTTTEIYAIAYTR